MSRSTGATFTILDRPETGDPSQFWLHILSGSLMFSQHGASRTFVVIGLGQLLDIDSQFYPAQRKHLDQLPLGTVIEINVTREPFGAAFEYDGDNLFLTNELNDHHLLGPGAAASREGVLGVGSNAWLEFRIPRKPKVGQTVFHSPFNPGLRHLKRD